MKKISFLQLSKVLSLMAAYSAPAFPAAAAPLISEIMASNDGGTLDEDGDASDWVEIFNPDATPADLAGWRLTDNASNLSKWTFPAGASLGPGQFMVVWASGKNRIADPAKLHTSFSLSANGEYLALVAPDGARVSEFAPSFPGLEEGESFGVPFSSTSLINSGTNSQTLVPTDDSLGTTWTQPSFNPGAGWINGPLHVGFGMPTPGFFIEERQAIGILTTLTTAESVLGGSGALDLKTAVMPLVNFTGDAGSDGRFGNGEPFLHGGDQSNFAVRATGTIVIPTTAPYTFAVNSDEGFRLRIDGVSVSSVTTLRPPGDTLVTRTMTAGEHPVILTYFENTGGDELELSAAPGTHTSFSSFFKLVGDTANGGLPVLAPAGNGPSIVTTDLTTPMQQVNSSAYVRVPFQVADPGALGALELSITWNDGFIAYLNGTMVAQRGAPAGAGWNAAATAARSLLDSLQPESINLSAFRPLLTTGTNVLAFHGLNSSSSDGSFLIAPRLGNARQDAVPPRFFRKASPGSRNPATGFLGHVNDTSFSHKRGFYTAPFQLTLRTSTPEATIRYTTDGSTPSPTNGTNYTEPLTIDKTIVIRAMATREGFEPTNVDTQTYLFLADVVEQGGPTTPYHVKPGPTWPNHGSTAGQLIDYGMGRSIIDNTNPALGGRVKVKEALAALPSMCITTDVPNLFHATTGIYTHPGSHGSAWERPGSIEMLGDPNTPEGGFHAPCGLRIRGGYSRAPDNPKHSFRLFFRDDYGLSKLEYPIFGGAGAQEFDAFDIQCSQNYSWSFGGDSNHNALREIWSRDAQLDLGSQSTRGRFVHLYLNAVYWGLFQIQERAEAAYGATYFGGNKDDYDVIKHTGSPGGYTTEATDGYFATLPDGTPSAWRKLWNASRASYWTNFNKNPASPGQFLISTPEQKLAAYFKMMGLQADGRTRTTDPILLDVDNLIDYILVVFFSKNGDSPLTGGGDRPNNFYTIRNRIGTLGFQSIQHDAEHSLNAGGASDRWGPFENPQTGTWNSFNSSNPQYLHQDLAASAEYKIRFADRLYRACFNDGPLTLAKNQARLDRRASQVEPAIIAESARWGDAKTSPALNAGHWRTARTATRNWFTSRTTQFITEARTRGFYPAVEPPTFSQRGGSVAPGTGITLTNPNAAGGTIYYTTDGSDPRPVGGGFLPAVLVPETANVTYLVPSESNGGSILTIPQWTSAADPENSANWSTGPMGLGYNPGGRPATTNFTPFIKTDVFSLMQPLPGAENGSLYVRVPFTLTAAQLEAARAFRIRVRYDDAIIVYLNGQEVARKIVAAAFVPSWNSVSVAVRTDTSAIIQEEIPVASFRSLLTEGPNVLAFHVMNQTSNNNDLLLSASVELDSPSAALGQTYTAPITLTSGTTIRTRVLNGITWSALNEAAFYTGTEPASAANLVVSEFSYNPDGPRNADEAAWSSSDFEFIELQNISTANVDLYKVTLDSAVTRVLSTAVQQLVIPPGGRLVIAANPAAFTKRYGALVPAIGPYEGSLDNAGETIRLTAANGSIIKDFGYRSTDPWPEAASGEGYSLVLINPTANPDHTKPANWRSSTTRNGHPGLAKGTSYSVWKTNQAITAEESDGDQDGLAAFAEYALGTSPVISDAAPPSRAAIRTLTVGQLSEPWLTLTFSRRLAADDVIYDVESSDSLTGTWLPSAGVLVSESNQGDGTATMVYRALQPVTPGQRLFLRLKMTLR